MELTKDEMQLLLVAMQAIANKDPDRLKCYDRISPPITSDFWPRLDMFTVDFRIPDKIDPEVFDEFEIVEFSDGRGLCVELPLYFSNPGFEGGHIVITFEVLRAMSPSIVSIHTHGN